jgi:hypothetical protein
MVRGFKSLSRYYYKFRGCPQGTQGTAQLCGLGRGGRGAVDAVDAGGIQAVQPEPGASVERGRVELGGFQMARSDRSRAVTSALSTSARNPRASAAHGLGPGGPGPVQGQKNQLQLQPGLAVIASHPGIVAPAAGVRKAPGLPPPGRCRPAGPGRQYSGPALAAGDGVSPYKRGCNSRPATILAWPNGRAADR